VQELPVTVGFPFERSFIPKQHRNPQTEWFRANKVGIVRKIDPDEARRAFRVRYPTKKRRMWTGKMLTIKACTLDLLHYDGAIWWPLHIWEEGFTPRQELRFDHFLRLLEEQPDLYGFMPRASLVTYDTGGFEFARKQCRDDEECNYAAVITKLRDNFLVCDNRVYIRGGAPVYTGSWLRDERRWVLGVVSAGADRAVDPAVHVSFTYRFWEQRPAIRFGNLWLATDRSAAVKACGVRDKDAPSIEVLAPELVTDVRIQLSLDAIYVSALRMFERPTPRFFKPKVARSIWERLATDGELTTDADVSAQRFEALSLLYALPVEHEPLKALKRDFRELTDHYGLDLPLFGLAVFGPKQELAPEDEAALASLV
jgi:hypothetical protein